MNHTLLTSESDRWGLAYSYIKIKCGNFSLWREEDLPKLEPFFKYSDECRGHFRPMTQEERDSFAYYKKCDEEYADDLSKKRDAVDYIDINTLIKTFGYKMPSDEDENGNEIDVEFDEDIPLKSTIDLTYPCVCVNWIKSDMDRMGKTSICAIDYVELKEFGKIS